ncbi:PD40 domain-containing protein [Candidatus Acetothermia bacterium]|nr:PD40 domain-containing protein [Candidatus Acetothermia bacterium]MBI3643417.1 PD40 domain-containing protein [Candidatus Acetothermia bacterium]
MRISRVLYFLLLIMVATGVFPDQRLVAAEPAGTNLYLPGLLSLKTKHFDVVFPAGFEELAKEAAIAAESAHQFWTSLLDFSSEEPIYLLLSDTQDEASASSRIFPQLVVTIDHPFGMESLLERRADRSLLEYLIYREVGSVLLQTRTEDFTHDLRIFFGNVILPGALTPHFYFAGLLGLGDTSDAYTSMIVSGLINSNRLPSVDQLSNPYTKWDWPISDVGTLSVSKEFLHDLEQSLGEETFRDVYRFSVAFPLPSLTVGALESLSQHPMNEIYSQFQVSLQEKFMAENQRFMADSSATSKRVSLESIQTDEPRWSPSGDLLLYHASGLERSPGLRLILLRQGKDVPLLDCDCRSANWLDPSTLIYAKAVRQPDGKLYGELFSYDLLSHNERQYTDRERVWAVVPMPTSATDVLLLRSGHAGRSNLVLFNLATRNRIIIRDFSPDDQLLSVAVSADGQVIALTLSEKDAGVRIHLIARSGKELQVLGISKAKVFDPSFSLDGRFLFITSDFEGRYQIYAVRLADQEVSRVVASSTGVREARVSADGGQLAYVGYEADGFGLRTAKVDPNQWKSLGSIKNLIGRTSSGESQTLSTDQNQEIENAPISAYQAEQGIIPTFWVPIIGRWNVGEYTSNVEPTGQISYQLNLGTSYSPFELFYDFWYNHKTPVPWVRLHLQGTASYQIQTALLEFPLSPDPNSSKFLQVGIYRSPDQTELFAALHLPEETQFDLSQRISTLSVRGGLAWTIAGLARRISADWDERLKIPFESPIGPQWLDLSSSVAWSDIPEFLLGGLQGDRPLRGHPTLLRGSQRISINLAYDFPIWNINWGCCGYHTLPVFLNELRGSLFTDMGLVGKALNIENLRVGIGIEFQLHLIIGFGLLDGWLHGGFAYGIGAQQPQFYFDLQKAF